MEFVACNVLPLWLLSEHQQQINITSAWDYRHFWQ